jgi:D-sedoheptulose 7-phosphate isomerase
MNVRPRIFSSDSPVIHDTNFKAPLDFYEGKGSTVSQASTYPHFFSLISECIQRTRSNGEALLDIEPKSSSWEDRLNSTLSSIADLFRRCHKRGNKVIFIGNGGSAAIASHMAIDYTKNGGIRAIALNDLAALTCVANDFGYEQVFAKQLQYHARKGDVVVILSTSGRSPNILEAASAVRELGCDLITLSGMNPNNSLRKRGLINLYVPSIDYGLVELTHMALLHSIVSVEKSTP